jgi:hypothetical protein
MYRAMILSIPLLLGGCIAGSAVAPGTLPPGANAGIYTSVDPQTVASCIAAALGTTSEVQGDRIVVATPGGSGLRYSVGPNGDGVYRTQIAVFGVEQDPVQTARVQACFAPPAAN